MTTKEILYIEDNFHNRRIVRKILEREGYSLVECEDGLEGYEKLKEIRPGVVLLDISLPTMDGMEIAGLVKQNPDLASTFLIALTASAMQGDRERFLAGGCDDYLSKPFRAQDLVDMVNHYDALVSGDTPAPALHEAEAELMNGAGDVKPDPEDVVKVDFSVVSVDAAIHEAEAHHAYANLHTEAPAEPADEKTEPAPAEPEPAEAELEPEAVAPAMEMPGEPEVEAAPAEPAVEEVETEAEVEAEVEAEPEVEAEEEVEAAFSPEAAAEPEVETEMTPDTAAGWDQEAVPAAETPAEDEAAAALAEEMDAPEPPVETGFVAASGTIIETLDDEIEDELFEAFSEPADTGELNLPAATAGEDLETLLDEEAAVLAIDETVIEKLADTAELSMETEQDNPVWGLVTETAELQEADDEEEAAAFQAVPATAEAPHAQAVEEQNSNGKPKEEAKSSSPKDDDIDLLKATIMGTINPDNLKPVDPNSFSDRL